MTKKGFYWHVHHDILFEWCYDYDKRANFIRSVKPPSEVPERLKRFKKVKGKLPTAIKVLAKVANKAYYQYINKGGTDKLLDNWKRTRGILQHAMWTYRHEINRLHTKECPNCSWDGRQMVFETKENVEGQNTSVANSMDLSGL